eukprot:TRINITY_DN6692_c0_g1_i1.p1 TRINITY_DN6692_c0_g1~~TRINITY_DN6692_c0_g1_i1.p1  ORF type:complete len:923 (+),score=170.02 TRINITY_DN6692_c0_g1_i1:17-2785(+)
MNYALTTSKPVPIVMEGTYPMNDRVSFRYQTPQDSRSCRLFVFPIRIPSVMIYEQNGHNVTQSSLSEMIQDDMSCWNYFMERFEVNVNGDELNASQGEIEVVWEVKFSRARNLQAKRSRYEECPPVYLMYCLVIEDFDGKFYMVSNFLHGIETVSKMHIFEKKGEWEPHRFFGQIIFLNNEFPIDMFGPRKESLLRGKAEAIPYPVVSKLFPDSIEIHTKSAVTLFGDALLFVQNVYFGNGRCELSIRENKHIWLLPPVYTVVTTVPVFVEVHAGTYYDTGLLFNYTENTFLKSMKKEASFNQYDDEIISPYNEMIDTDLGFSDQRSPVYNTYRNDFHWNAMYGNTEQIHSVYNSEGGETLLNERDCLGCTPFFLAVYFKRFDIAQILLDYSADFDKPTWEGVHPIHIAAFNHDEKMLELLCECYETNYPKDVRNWDIGTLPTDVYKRTVLDYMTMKHDHMWKPREPSSRVKCYVCDETFTGKESWCKLCRKYKHNDCEGDECIGIVKSRKKLSKSTNLENSQEIATDSRENDSREELIDSVLENISKAELLFEEKYGNDSVIEPLVSPIFGKLKKLTRLQVNAPPNIYLVGKTGAAKSSLINSICGKIVAPVGNDTECTAGVERYEVSDVNAVFWDTRGIDHDFKECMKLLKDAVKEYPPDVVILCIARNSLREDDLSSMQKMMKIINKTTRKVYGAESPVIVMITKCDINSTVSSRKFYQNFESAAEELTEEMSTVLEKNAKIQSLIAGLKKNSNQTVLKTFCKTDDMEEFTHNVGIGELFAILSNNINKQVKMKMETRIEFTRRVLASKIVSSFTALNGAISLVPLADIPITYITTKLMLRILSAFSKTDTNGYDSYIEAHSMLVSATNVVRGSILLGSFLVNLSLVGIIVGEAVGAAGSGALTAGIGWHAYNFFTKEK